MNKEQKRIIFSVTNDLVTDQRMARICTSLSKAGFDVILVGRVGNSQLPLAEMPYQQKRLPCFFLKGKGFYIEFNIRLFFYLLFQRMDVVCAIDLDTILPNLFISKLKGVYRIYDAHELFCEMKEIVTRPKIYRAWKTVEKYAVPKFTSGYTVNALIAGEFKKMYKVDYRVIRNLPVFTNRILSEKKSRFILYQGAVNEGRGFETLIPAMKNVNVPLVICGEGNFLSQAKSLVLQLGLEDKIIFKGRLLPEQLKAITEQAWAGVTLFDKTGHSNYFSLANRFFDYCHAGVPQVCVAYPLYKELNNQYTIAVLIDEPQTEMIAEALNRLLNDDELHSRLIRNCLEARKVLNWQNEEKELIAFYEGVLK
ncbi:MAG TPA: glycosyltransferase [Flavitalea sp.]|nr:glycosyltransferase [Flavitalea sp.]